MLSCPLLHAGEVTMKHVECLSSYLDLALPWGSWDEARERTPLVEEAHLLHPWLVSVADCGRAGAMISLMISLMMSLAISVCVRACATVSFTSRDYTSTSFGYALCFIRLSLCFRLAIPCTSTC